MIYFYGLNGGFKIMIIIHSVQKLLNTSRLKATLFVSQPEEGQQLHSWYAMLLPTGFPGKLFVMYVHEPSLMIIVCKGKTISGSWDQFRKRLHELLRRFQFPQDFISREMKALDRYIVSKTNSKSLIAHMNQMAFQLKYGFLRYPDYDSIPMDLMEERMMDYLYQQGPKNTNYRTPLKYWKEKLGLPGKD